MGQGIVERHLFFAVHCGLLSLLSCSCYCLSLVWVCIFPNPCMATKELDSVVRFYLILPLQNVWILVNGFAKSKKNSSNRMPLTRGHFLEIRTTWISKKVGGRMVLAGCLDFTKLPSCITQCCNIIEVQCAGK